MRWTDLAGAAALCGVGFTMSLYIAALAFGDGAEAGVSKLGVLVGSLASAGLGLALLRRNPLPPRHAREPGRGSPA